MKRKTKKKRVKMEDRKKGKFCPVCGQVLLSATAADSRWNTWELDPIEWAHEPEMHAHPNSCIDHLRRQVKELRSDVDRLLEWKNS